MHFLIASCQLPTRTVLNFNWFYIYSNLCFSHICTSFFQVFTTEICVILLLQHSISENSKKHHYHSTHVQGFFVEPHVRERDRPGVQEKRNKWACLVKKITWHVC
jgi:hypothetical protein